MTRGSGVTARHRQGPVAVLLAPNLGPFLPSGIVTSLEGFPVTRRGVRPRSVNGNDHGHLLSLPLAISCPSGAAASISFGVCFSLTGGTISHGAHEPVDQADPRQRVAAGCCPHKHHVGAAGTAPAAEIPGIVRVPALSEPDLPPFSSILGVPLVPPVKPRGLEAARDILGLRPSNFFWLLLAEETHVHRLSLLSLERGELLEEGLPSQQAPLAWSASPCRVRGGGGPGRLP